MKEQYNYNNNKYLLQVLNYTFFFRMKYIIIYIIISSKGFHINIDIFSMLSPDIKIFRNSLLL